MRYPLLVLVFMCAATDVIADGLADANAGMNALNASDYSKAITLFTRAIDKGRLGPDDKELAYVKRAQAYMGEKNKAQALADIDKATSLKPDDPEISALRQQVDGGSVTDGASDATAALAAEHQGNYNEAVRLFTRALQSGGLSDADRESAYVERARSYLKENDDPAALSDAEKALSLNPGDNEAVAIRDQARTQASPETTTPQHQLVVSREVGTILKNAQALAAAGSYKEALAKVNEAEAVTSRPDDAMVINQTRQYIAVKSGDVASGGALAAKAKFAQDYNSGRFKDAIADEELLRSAGALDAQSQVVIAQAYYKTGDYAGCVRYTQIIAESEVVLQLKARCAYEAGDKASERQAFSRLITLTGKLEYKSALLKLSENQQ